ncbi:MAG: CNNM domain-containing protein [Pirellulaceae bacterium]
MDSSTTSVIPQILAQLPVLVALLAASAFCSASEAALFSLSWVQRKKLNPQRASDERIQSLLANADRLLSGVLLWNLSVNMLFFALVGGLSTRLARQEGGQWWAAVTSLGAMAMVILFGELLPKSLAVLAPLPISRWVSLPLSIALRLIDPVASTLRWFSEMSRRLLMPGIEAESYLATSDLEQAIELSSEDSALVTQEKTVLRQVIQLSDLRAEEWMKPLSHYPIQRPSTQKSWSLQGNAQEKYLLIADHSGTDIVASVPLADLSYKQLSEWERAKQPVLVVPWCAQLSAVQQQMSQQARQVAVVVNEYGEIVGVITWEDLIDAMFEVPSPQAPLVSSSLVEGAQPPPTRWVVSGGVSLKRIERHLGVRLPKSRFLTFSGLLHDQLRRDAVPGDVILWEGYQLRVMESVAGGDVQIELTQLESPEDAS